MSEIWGSPERRIQELEAEIERLQELLRGVGANRYWEGRWRDEVDAFEPVTAEELAEALLSYSGTGSPMQRTVNNLFAVFGPLYRQRKT